MDRPSYSVMENVGEGELGLMVCATVLEADFDFTVLLIPEDDTAQGSYTYITRFVCVYRVEPL